MAVAPSRGCLRLHAGIGYVTLDDEHEGRGEAIGKRRALKRLDSAASPTIARPPSQPTRGRSMLAGTCAAKSETV